jgi:prevent-host-death family protein
MERVYSLYDAKARFSELIRIVRKGKQVIITFHGERVAVIQPYQEASASLENRIAGFEKEGVLQGPDERSIGMLEPVVVRPGALQRFLEDRE